MKPAPLLPSYAYLNEVPSKIIFKDRSVYDSLLFQFKIVSSQKVRYVFPQSLSKRCFLRPSLRQYWTGLVLGRAVHTRPMVPLRLYTATPVCCQIAVSLRIPPERIRGFYSVNVVYIA